MKFPELLAFMLVDRKDLGRACVGATTFRRQHPEWRLHLFVQGALPTPWTDLGAYCFDRRTCVLDVPLARPDHSHFGISNWMRISSLERIFDHLFEEGVSRATYISHDHVWFGPLYSLERNDVLDDGVNVIRASRSVSRQSRGLEDLVALSMRAGDKIASFVRENELPDDITPLRNFSSDNTLAISNPVLGLTLDDLHRKQLRFDSRGQLRLGDEAVLSACLGDQYRSVSSKTIVDTIWIELEKWYFSEQKRFN